MHQPQRQRLRWRKSSYSGGEGGDCVEVAETPDGSRYIRDTKDRTQPVLYFTAAEWDAFIRGVKDGELG